MLAGTTFNHVASRQKHLSALWISVPRPLGSGPDQPSGRFLTGAVRQNRNFGECWCGVHGLAGVESRLAVGASWLRDSDRSCRRRTYSQVMEMILMGKKSPPKALGPSDLDYAFRRVIYDAMVAKRSLRLFKERKGEWALGSVARMAGLMMARNLFEFFSTKTREKDDDVRVTDFKLKSWKPKGTLTRDDVDRLHKVVGHIVCEDPNPFTQDEFVRIVQSQLEDTCKFIDAVQTEGAATLTGNAAKYLSILRK